MTVARSVADVLAEHVRFEVECIDRMYCNVYVPQLQHAGGLLGYVQRQLGLPIASTAPLAKITDRFVREMHRFAATGAIPWVDFAKGQRKDDVMHEHLARFTAEEGVLFIGRAQEKTTLFRTEKRRDAQGRSYPWVVKTTGMVNHFYLYCVDADFGPFFIKFCSYFPYNAKLCLNGHEWAKRQAAQAGIGFSALDNGFAAIENPAAVQAICDQFGPTQIDALLRKWLAIVPHPFTAADRAAGYRYDISILQAEFSLTQMLDRPVTGRVFFEHVIRDNLDAGRPDQVSLIFDRRLMHRRYRGTPGRFRTRVIKPSSKGLPSGSARRSSGLSRYSIGDLERAAVRPAERIPGTVARAAATAESHPAQRVARRHRRGHHRGRLDHRLAALQRGHLVRLGGTATRRASNAPADTAAEQSTASADVRADQSEHVALTAPAVLRREPQRAERHARRAGVRRASAPRPGRLPRPRNRRHHPLEDGGVVGQRRRARLHLRRGRAQRHIHR
jgi:hypothetical protein